MLIILYHAVLINFDFPTNSFDSQSNQSSMAGHVVSLVPLLAGHLVDHFFPVLLAGHLASLPLLLL